MNIRYSHKDLTGRKFLAADPNDFSNSTIDGSCFAQELPYSSDASRVGSINHRNTRQNVFPVGVTGVTFVDCNLDNVALPSSSALVRCSNRKIRVMNDNQDWVLDESNNEPVVPMDIKRRLRRSESVDPADIPMTRTR